MTNEEPSGTWEVPEFASIGVLLAVGVLIAAGIAAGVSQVVNESGPNITQTIGTDIQLATGWASWVVSIVLLAVITVCWWQVTAWAEVANDEGQAGENGTALLHLGRGVLTGKWTAGLLGFIGLGAIMSFVGAVLNQSSAPPGPFVSWSTVITPAGNVLAVLVVVTVGLLVAWTFLPRASERSE